MTLDELVVKVQAAVQDVSIADEDSVIAWLNDALEDASSQVDIPELRTSDVISTVLNQSWTDIPSDYQRNLYFAVNSTQGVEITVKQSFQEILKIFPLVDQVGSVTMVTIDEGAVSYQAIPETIENLTLYYSRSPARMVAGNDEPEGIPSHCQDQVLVSYAAAQGWDLIEQGLDDKKVNLNTYTAKYFLGLKRLRAYWTPRRQGFRA